MDVGLRQKMVQLTSKCQVLQRNGKYVECIDIMQQIVSIKKSVFGIDHFQFQRSSQKLCQYLNLAAMAHLQKQNFQLTIDYLRKAQLVARNSLPMKSTTYNNLACYYRRTGKVRTALSYLIQALQLQLKIEEPKTLADTHLNLCAVLSQLNRHEDALQHSMLSIILLQDEFLSTLLPKAKLTDLWEEVSEERMPVLAIAYHNLGVEFEHLKRVSSCGMQFQEALKIYKKALHFTKENLPENQSLVKKLTKVVSSATEQIEEQRNNYVSKGSKNGNNVQKTYQEPKISLYRDLSKKVERYRHLPKLKFNSKEHAGLLDYQSIDYSQEQQNGRNQSKLGFGNIFHATPPRKEDMESELKVKSFVQNE